MKIKEIKGFPKKKYTILEKSISNIASNNITFGYNQALKEISELSFDPTKYVEVDVEQVEFIVKASNLATKVGPFEVWKKLCNDLIKAIHKVNPIKAKANR